MISVSSAFLEENKKLVSSPEGKIIIDGLPEITAGGLLQSFTVERYDNEFGKLFGNAISRKIDAVFMDNGFRQADIVGKKITAYTGHNGESVNFTPCYVSELTYDKITDIWNLTAYDVLGEFNKYTVDAFYNAYPDIDFTSETLGSFAAKVISFVNSQSEHDIAPSDEGFFNSDLVLGAKPNFGGSENLRTVLMQIAECGFCNCIVNRSGKIEFRAAFKTNPVYEISPKTYYELSAGDNYGAINSLVLKRLPYEDNAYAQDGASISENGLCEIVISDNAFLDDKRATVAIPMLEKVKGYNLLNAYYLDWKGNAALDTSDCVRIKGIDENSPDIVTMFYGEIFTYDGSASSISELILPENSQTDYSSAQNAMLYDRMKKTEIKVDKVNAEINMSVSDLTADIEKVKNALSNTDASAEELAKELEGIQGKFTAFTETLDGFKLSIGQIEDDLEKNSKTFKNTMVDIDINGITVGQYGVDVISKHDATGLHIYNTGGGKVADFSDEGLRAKDVIVKNLNAAGTLFKRFNQNGKTWVGAFWIGEDDLWD